MPAKTPIYLKTSTPKRGKKVKLRDVLSGDMISPPLGDFRHSAHIGLDGEGDMFGELSFLQGKYDLLPGYSQRLASQSADGRLHAELSRGGYCGFLKNAVSLPVFSGNPCQDRAPPKPPRLHLEEDPIQRSMFVTFHSQEDISFSSSLHHEPVATSLSFATTSTASSEGSLLGSNAFDHRERLNIPSSAGSINQDGNVPPLQAGLAQSGSLAGLDLDLGPSILDDVLRIMDGYKA
ncbi:cdc42 effector protein 2-like [Microcaecilia unicolor]|uniref:Cdc42 effector protein 2-like n=1 Tax=Microcaecilia unicolor TaxID=1415580 RepID=A0A6P7ZJM6_9AMPH|nr:cdc42 effector protein 2-like [Microcaecilia unicolor]XP_030075031.1 cdc42 effector protein 2-like [Microcaecilia unicolor]